MLVLALNDHLLKARFPGFVTGKLSDVAGLVCFPVLLAAAIEKLRPGARTMLACALVTGVVFAAVKMWRPANEAYSLALAALQWPVRALASLVRGGAMPAV